MTYIFGIYVVVSGLLIGYLVWALLEMESRHRDDVDKLEKRMLMLTRPEALAADAIDEEVPKAVDYMDDERMAILDRRT